MHSILFWLWLSRCCTPGSGTFDLLLRHFDTPYDIYDADEAALREALAKYDKDLQRLLDKDTAAAERTLRFCAMTGVTMIPYDDPRYPAALRLIPSPPVLLYCKGTLPQFNGTLSVAVVGTRETSDYGKRMAFEIARDLARAGAIVVSGLALGVDGVANAAAINGGGETVAVLGSGIDVIYPPAHAKLAECVMRHGAVITEFAPGTRPDGRNFPIRNRIISGLASATAVIEADLVSGALITARRALQQGRPLYALPGRVDEKGSEGTCMLLKNGAKLLVAADDILTDFEKLYADKINIFKLLRHSPVVMDAVLKSMRVQIGRGKKQRSPEDQTSTAKSTAPEAAPKVTVDPAREAEVREILERLGELPTKIYGLVPSVGQISCDDLAEAGLSIGEVMAATATMEIEGVIEVLPGGLLKRKP